MCLAAPDEDDEARSAGLQVEGVVGEGGGKTPVPTHHHQVGVTVLEVQLHRLGPVPRARVPRRGLAGGRKIINLDQTNTTFRPPLIQPTDLP